MGGFFGTVSKTSCVTDLFYGTDYNSHLGTKRGGLATYSEEKVLYAPFTIWKVLISEPSLKENWTNSKETPASASLATQTHNLSSSILTSGASPLSQSLK